MEQELEDLKNMGAEKDALIEKLQNDLIEADKTEELQRELNKA